MHVSNIKPKQGYYSTMDNLNHIKRKFLSARRIHEKIVLTSQGCITVLCALLKAGSCCVAPK